jgi:hypothetical protein
VPPPWLGGVVVVGIVVVGVVVVLVVVGVVSVLVVVVGVVLVWVPVVEVEPGVGWRHIASACLCRFEMPCWSCRRRPLSIDAGNARKSCSVLPSADSVSAQLPLPVAAALATASKSF